jgi:hypothetical protein
VTDPFMERFGPFVEEYREALSALRLARHSAGDAFEALELARRLGAQADEDYRRAEAHFRLAFELLDALLEDEE